MQHPVPRSQHTPSPAPVVIARKQYDSPMAYLMSPNPKKAGLNLSNQTNVRPRCNVVHSKVRTYWRRFPSFSYVHVAELHGDQVPLRGWRERGRVPEAHQLDEVCAFATIFEIGFASPTSLISNGTIALNNLVAGSTSRTEMPGTRFAVVSMHSTSVTRTNGCTWPTCVWASNSCFCKFPLNVSVAVSCAFSDQRRSTEWTLRSRINGYFASNACIYNLDWVHCRTHRQQSPQQCNSLPFGSESYLPPGAFPPPGLPWAFLFGPPSNPGRFFGFCFCVCGGWASDAVNGVR